MSRHGFWQARPVEEHRPVSGATVRRVVSTFGPYRRKVVFVGLMIVITAGLGVVNPLLIVAVFDNALFGPNNNCAGQP